jgi:hypothetical protein
MGDRFRFHRSGPKPCGRLSPTIFIVPAICISWFWGSQLVSLDNIIRFECLFSSHHHGGRRRRILVETGCLSDRLLSSLNRQASVLPSAKNTDLSGTLKGLSSPTFIGSWFMGSYTRNYEQRHRNARSGKFENRQTACQACHRVWGNCRKFGTEGCPH